MTSGPITPKGHPRPEVGSRWWHTPTQQYVVVTTAAADEQATELTVTVAGKSGWRVVRRGDLLRDDLRPEGRTKHS